jgi:hypothetical protein
MKTPLRLGATVALGALLLVGLLASPALAWEWGVSAEAVCEEGGTTARVDFIVQSHEEGAEGDVAVVAVVDGQPFGEPVTGQLENDTFKGSFTGVPLDAKSVKVKAFVQWKGEHRPEQRKADVELPKDCQAPPTTAPPTTAPPTTAPAPPATEAPTTTEGEALPFTGASSGPLLLAAIALVGGGLVILWASRLRGRHEAR